MFAILAQAKISEQRLCVSENGDNHWPNLVKKITLRAINSFRQSGTVKRLEIMLSLIDNGFQRVIYSTRCFTRENTTKSGCHHTGVLLQITLILRTSRRARGHFRQSS